MKSGPARPPARSVALEPFSHPGRHVSFRSPPTWLAVGGSEVAHASPRAGLQTWHSESGRSSRPEGAESSREISLAAFLTFWVVRPVMSAALSARGSEYLLTGTRFEPTRNRVPKGCANKKGRSGRRADKAARVLPPLYKKTAPGSRLNGEQDRPGAP